MNTTSFNAIHRAKKTLAFVLLALPAACSGEMGDTEEGVLGTHSDSLEFIEFWPYGYATAIASVSGSPALAGTLFRDYRGEFCRTREGGVDRNAVLFAKGVETDFRSACNMPAESVLTINDNWTLDIEVDDRSTVGRSLYLESKNSSGQLYRQFVIEWVKVKEGSKYGYVLQVYEIRTGRTARYTLRGSGKMTIAVGKSRIRATYGQDEAIFNLGFVGVGASKKAILASWEAPSSAYVSMAAGAQNPFGGPGDLTSGLDDALESRAEVDCGSHVIVVATDHDGGSCETYGEDGVECTAPAQDSSGQTYTEASFGSCSSCVSRLGCTRHEKIV